MKRIIFVFVAGLFLSNTVPVNAQQAFDVYIGAGQSNFDGRGDASDLTGGLASFATPQAGTLIYYNNPPEPDPNDTLDQAITTNGFVTLQPGYAFFGARDFGDVVTLPSGLFGPEVSFGSAISAEVGSSNPVAIIKVARGATNLDNDWRAADPTDPNDEGGPLYAELLDTITAATAELTANGDTFTIRGFIWHQGESDSGSSGRRGRYEQNFSNLMAGVRAHVGEPDLPFVIGELAQSRTSSSNPEFIALQAQIASNLEIGFVSSVGLTTPLSTGDGDDGTHFDAAGQIELGLRFATELAALINDGVTPPTSELVTFDLDNGPTPGEEPLGIELDSLDDPSNPVDSPSTATLAGITFIATADTTIVDQTPSRILNPSGATYNSATNGAGVNSIGGSADGDGGAAAVDPGETLTLTLNFDASTTTVALTEITFRQLGDVSDSATISIAGGAGIALHDDVSAGQVANTTFTFAGDTFNTAAPVSLSSGDTIVFTNVTASDNYQITGFTLEVQTTESCLLGDVDLSGDVDFLDIAPFISVLSGGTYQCEADSDQSGMVDFLDIAPFISILSGP